MLAEHKRECFDRIIEIRKIHEGWRSHLNGARAQRIRANLEKNYERTHRASEALERYRTRADELREKIVCSHIAFASHTTNRLNCPLDARLIHTRKLGPSFYTSPVRSPQYGCSK